VNPFPTGMRQNAFIMKNSDEICVGCTDDGFHLLAQTVSGTTLIYNSIIRGFPKIGLQTTGSTDLVPAAFKVYNTILDSNDEGTNMGQSCDCRNLIFTGNNADVTG